MSESPYMTSEECIAYLRLDRLRSPQSALYRLIQEHRLPTRRAGRLYLFDRRDVDAWTQGHNSALEMARARKAS